MRAPLLRALSPVAAAIALAGLITAPVLAQDAAPAPNRAEGEGPFDRLIIRGATLIDGTGAPPRGPVDIVVERNRITQIVDVGFPDVPIDQRGRPKGPAREIEADGDVRDCRASSTCTCTPCGVPKAPEAEYCLQALARPRRHDGARRSVRRLRVVAQGDEAQRTKNEITAPRMYHLPAHRHG